MKKAACAVLGLSAFHCAFAQSSVSLYGIAESGVSYSTHASSQGDSVVSQTSGALSTSRYGLKGREDLGGGYAAIFTLEQGYSLANGAGVPQGWAWARDSWVGLDSPYGKVTLGRTYAPILEGVYMVDPMIGSTGTASTLGLGQLSNLTPGGGYRLDSTVKYSTPTSWGPLSASLLYAFGSPGTDVQKSDLGAYVGYLGNPFTIVAAYNRQANPWDAAGTLVNAIGALQAPPAVAGSAYLNNWNRKSWVIGATYSYKAAELYGGYSGTLDEVGGIVNRNYHTQLFWAGASYYITPALNLRGGYYKLLISDTSTHPTLLGAVLDYFLSKSVDTYMAVAFIRNGGDSSVSFPTVSGISAGVAQVLSDLSHAPVAAGSVKTGANQLQLLAGLRYKF